ncbi:MAG: VOC family protein [Bacteroidetes bacterium]|nr:VOC family protein [Bacteroidota bacterium]
MEYIISGIQQLGVGVPNVHDGFGWYRKHFGIDIPILNEASEANLMLPYTGNKPHQRHAILAISGRGGGGLEIWQYTSRVPQPCSFNIELGDLGILIGKIKTENISKTLGIFNNKGIKILGEISQNPIGQKHFYCQDVFGNMFEVIESKEMFNSSLHETGGVIGAVLGVSNIEKSKKFYADILGYDKVLHEEESVFSDLEALPSGKSKCHRVLLTHSKGRQGSFSTMLGTSYIELIKIENKTPRKIFENRFWGDLGFIHLCFDIKNMDALRKACQQANTPFTVDSGTHFEMGDAAGHFSYIEDPDGTLIEFVETFKIPILKKLGWYLDLRKRNPQKPLPNWMLKTLRFSRVKD